ncbi:protein translocase subunit SecD [Pimelobacter simplex]|uniref:protein translocase subunit SecD n=1 Tax=Nocardioides simplex TaxID=2045 RepID=UPI003AABB88A
MASRRSHPGRHLVVFFIGVAILYGLTALSQAHVDKGETAWKPALGLDLQGGVRITLSADGSPSKENLDEARRIIDQRVNGSGVAEASVATQGGRNIVVEVPGKTADRDQLEETVRRQAQLRFRLVACYDQNPGPCAAPDPAAGLGRAPLDLAADDETPTPSGSPSETPSGTPSDTASGTPDAEQPAGDVAKATSVKAALAWIDAPDQAAIAQYNAYTCDPKGVLVDAQGKPADLPDDPAKPLVACSKPEDGVTFKFLMSASVIEGTELTDASAQVPQNSVKWVVAIRMGNTKDKAFPKGSSGAATDFEAVSRAMVNTDKQFAVVLDGQVLTYPTMNGIITDGRSQIEGNFTEVTALDLANSLKFGALPIKFSDKNTSVEEIGPSLAGNQLKAGITAGAIGLALVMLYCLFYYRGLGLVVVSSLFVAAGITYALVLLLSKTAGFTLTLPGIAGLIIAVGVTADSFVIFFERIRDEMREGKSMRVAVETGWARARVTRVAANTVQILSAVVLYIFATGAVKGFGFALGLTTLIDLAVLFWFTKPMVSWLAQFKAFNSGHKLSGLSKETLGMDVPTPRRTAAAGGDA